MANHCPLCQSKEVSPFYSNQAEQYFNCAVCDLIFLSADNYLSDNEEKSRYELHNNDPEDLEYRQFLSKVLNPVISTVKQGAKGLDFGSGPGPTLSIMLEEQGFKVDLFDKYYANNPSVFNNQYDFITATEVLEHLHDPDQVLDDLFQLLTRSGVLAVMTSLHNYAGDFASWYYKNDPTHVCFYSKTTMNYLSIKFGATVKFYGQDVVLFVKN